MEQESYTYIDKISQALSKDLALYYIREALRDFHTLLSRGFENEGSRKLASEIDFRALEEEIERIRRIDGVAKLREELSAIVAQALSKSAHILYGAGA